MSDSPGALDPSGWATSVLVREDPALASELSGRWESATTQRSIAITDLLGLRRAFWRQTAPPVSLSAERVARIETGRRVHRVLEELLAPEGSIEVRVRRRGVVGRIDALTDRPIEFKSTAFATEPGDLIEDRPEHIEQLGLYCVLTGVPNGRLITVVPGTGSGPEIRTADLAFSDLGAWSREMERRAAQLRAALARGNPSGLPKCRWYNRGCEYREGPVCDCVGTEPGDTPFPGCGDAGITPRPDLDRSLGPRFRDRLERVRPSSIGRFRDLLYPRRTYHERRQGPGGGVPEGPRPRAEPPPDSYYRLVDAIEGGPVGEVARLLTRSDEPEEEVPAFRGTPYLARTSSTSAIPNSERILTRNPQYALELGFRCAATGSAIGRAIVAYERSTDPRHRVRVFEFRFDPVTTFSRIWRSRLASLERALATGDPSDLPACPGWMHADCPYRAECGCAADLERSQR